MRTHVCAHSASEFRMHADTQARNEPKRMCTNTRTYTHAHMHAHMRARTRTHTDRCSGSIRTCSFYPTRSTRKSCTTT